MLNGISVLVLLLLAGAISVEAGARDLRVAEKAVLLESVRFKEVAVLDKTKIPPFERVDRDLALYPSWGDSNGFYEEVPVEATYYRPGLAGFFFDFDHDDHEIARIEARALTDTVQVEYSGALPTFHSYHWELDRQELPPGTTFHHHQGSVGIGGISARLGMPGELPGVPVLTGFLISANQEHHLERIKVQVSRDQFDQLNLEIVFEDDDWSGDDFFYRVDYAVVPSNKVRCKPVLQGSSNTGSDYKAIDAKHPVLQGFDLNFTNGDHEMDQIGVMLDPRSMGGQAFVHYNDRNNDDNFSWKVWWVDVSKDEVNEVTGHDRYVEFGGRDSFRGVVRDCSDPSHPCGTLNHAIRQADSGDTIKVASGETAAGGSTIEIRPSAPMQLKIEGGWGFDFTQRELDMNGFNFSYLYNERFDIVADGIPLDLTISGFIVTRGSAENGGAIQVGSLNGGTATVNIENNKIHGNTATRYGGGLYAYSRASRLVLNLRDNLILDNRSDKAGGGILVESYASGTSTVNLSNNIIADNSARDYGGGAFFNAESGIITANLKNNTIAHNSAADHGGGLVARSVSAEAGVYVDVANSIVWGNESPEDVFLSEFPDATTLVSARFSNIGGVRSFGGAYNDSEGNISQNPFFLDPLGGDYHLEMGSPAIDSGICGSAATRYDFEGDKRDNFCDMGADEFVGGVGFDPCADLGGDRDQDGFCDLEDNCPYIENSDQADHGGLLTNSPNGVGDACQCGDVTGDGLVNGIDSTFIRRQTLGLSAPLFLVPGNCDVTGDGRCDGTDATIISRVVLGLRAPLFGNHCPNFTNRCEVDSNGNCLP
jgi:hypothetical protein